MKKFDQLVNEVYREILLEQPPEQPGLPQDGGPTAQPQQGQPQQAPAQQPQQAPEQPEPEAPKPLSTEGKRFLVDLARRALVVSPDQLDATDNAIFEDPVTVVNADEIADKLTEIVNRLNPSTTAPSE
jgi:hypothetical protein